MRASSVAGERTNGEQRLWRCSIDLARHACLFCRELHWPSDCQRVLRVVKTRLWFEFVLTRRSSRPLSASSFSDPSHVQGLAHFLEHMVFMGSQRYPGEDEFDEFVSSHGGYTNAHTDAEETCFLFEVQVGEREKAVGSTGV